MKIKALNQLATEMVGDGKKQNVFFVCEQGNVVMITTDFDAAHSFWQNLACTRVDSTIEDRQTGVICSAGPERDEDGDVLTGTKYRWEVRDDSKHFGFRS